MPLRIPHQEVGQFNLHFIHYFVHPLHDLQPLLLQMLKLPLKYSRVLIGAWHILAMLLQLNGLWDPRGTSR